MKPGPADIDEYLAALPADNRAALEQLRRTIKAAAPDAVESIGYGIPSFKYKGRPLAYFAAAKNHLSLYGVSIGRHPEELAAYDTSKGTIRFTPKKPVPKAIVKKLVRARMAEIEAATARRKSKKPGAGGA